MLYLSAVKLAILAIFICSATYVHFRGQVRHRLRRQFLHHSTVMAPYNVLNQGIRRDQ